jgi:hypothetical protein
LLSELDASKSALEKALVKLKRYRQAVLKAAVEGELSRGWRGANKHHLEPVSVLLQRVLARHRALSWGARKYKKTIRLSLRPTYGAVTVTRFSPDPRDRPMLPAAQTYLLRSPGFPTPTGGTQDEAPRPIGAESAALSASYYCDLLGLIGFTRLHLPLFQENQPYWRFLRFGHASRQLLALDPAG